MRHFLLVVEDDESIRESLKEILEGEGHVVQTASHGREALDVLSRSADFSLILLDLTMPVMNGWDFLRARNANPIWARIPVVVCSATGDKREPELATHILRKPIELKKLFEMIERYSVPVDRAS